MIADEKKRMHATDITPHGFFKRFNDKKRMDLDQTIHYLLPIHLSIYIYFHFFIFSEPDCKQALA